MNINLNPQGLTTFAKSLVGIIGTAVMLWQVPQVHDAVAPILAAHPHIYSILSLGVVVWGVLHNPQKKADAPPVIDSGAFSLAGAGKPAVKQ